MIGLQLDGSVVPLKRTARRGVRAHWWLGSAAFLAVMVTAVAPAWAAAPANDKFAGATVVSSTPFQQTEDTTKATTDAADVQANADCGAPATEASVWFSYTPTAPKATLVDVSKSNYSAGVIVVTGTPGNFTLVTCGPGEVGFVAAAGTTYSVLAFNDTPGGAGGKLELKIHKAPPPPQLSVTVDPTATVTKGRVTLTGTVTCTGKANFGPQLAVVLHQRVGRLLIHGRRFADASPCNGTQTWSVVVKGTDGVFGGGNARVNIEVDACGVLECSSAKLNQTITLHH
jgi:hypothetical protein